MFCSPSARQALRATIFLARQNGNSPLSAKVIAESEEIPRPYLAKLMQVLQKQGIVLSTMGPGGGYRLARPAGEIRITEVIDSFDGTDGFGDNCALGYKSCSDEEGCAFHNEWKSLREQYRRTIGSLSLKDAARAGPRGEGPS